MSGQRPVRVYTWRQPVPKPLPRLCAMQRRIVAEIAEHKITLSELARLTKMQIAHLRKLLEGRVRPAADTLARLDAAVEAAKAARSAASCCDRCGAELGAANLETVCAGCSRGACVACCRPLCADCSVPLAEAF